MQEFDFINNLRRPVKGAPCIFLKPSYFTVPLRLNGPPHYDIVNPQGGLGIADRNSLAILSTGAYGKADLRLNEGEAAQFPFDVSSTLYYRIHPEADEQTWGFGMFGTILF